MRQQLLALLVVPLLAGCGFFEPMPVPRGPVVVAFPQPSMVRASSGEIPLITIQLMARSGENALRTFQPVAYALNYFDASNTPLTALDVPRTAMVPPKPAAAGQPSQFPLDVAPALVVAHLRAQTGDAPTINCRVTLYEAASDAELMVGIPIRLD